MNVVTEDQGDVATEQTPAEVRTEAMTHAGEFREQLAVEADSIATLRASMDGVNEATAAVRTQAYNDASDLRHELALLRATVEELQLQRAGDAVTAHAAQAEALQAAAAAQQDRQHLEAELGRLGSEMEELRCQVELKDARPNRKQSKQKKKSKH